MHHKNYLQSRISINTIQIIILILIILMGAYFRFVGINWDQNYHLHPDERFLTMVEASIKPVNNIGEYFNTSQSSLNPHNVGYSFFVYGTLPIFLVRYIGQWVNQVGYGQIYIVGRYLSGFFDLLTILFVFLLSVRLYKNRWIGLIAVALASFSVLLIQQAHFFTVDSFTNFFTILAIYFAVCVLTDNPQKVTQSSPEKNINSELLTNWKGSSNYIFFGIALGLAAASKINTIVVAVMLPIASLIKFPTLFPKKHSGKWQYILRNLVLAAIVSFLVFRIFQPYAFSGPGFFNISINPKWLDNLKELSFLSSGDSNYPPSLQWARRPIWFGLQNMVIWGLGLPLGIIVILSFIWMGIKIIRGEWRSHLLVWLWTGLYFAWQSLSWNPTMRYFLPIYPTLTIIAAWGLVRLWQSSKKMIFKKRWTIDFRIISGIIIGFTILGTCVWAISFTNIYSQPVTRVSASDWIYQNVDGPINLIGKDDDSQLHIPLGYDHYYSIDALNPLGINFTSQYSGKITDITFDHIVDFSNNKEAKDIEITLRSKSAQDTIIAFSHLSDPFNMGDDPRGNSYKFIFDSPIDIQQNEDYFLQITLKSDQYSLRLAGNISVDVESQNQSFLKPVFQAALLMKKGSTYTIPFIPTTNGVINEISLFRVKDWNGNKTDNKLRFSIILASNDKNLLTSVELDNSFENQIDYRGNEYHVPLKSPLSVQAGVTYLLNIEMIEGDGSIGIYGSQQANETSWDDVIPLGMYGYNPFDYENGLYQPDFNLEMYWDDNSEKLQRIESILDQTDYIYITSNRQWGSVTQISERYPLSNDFYRLLLGCPDDQDIQWCYRIAEPSMFIGKLGFDLIKIFQSEPNFAGIHFNSQFAEEAFTVYDHPKVFIFKKGNSFSSNNVHSLLSNVDLTKVMNLSPVQANRTPGDLNMSETTKEIQENGGTWLDLFDQNSFLNRYPLLGLIVWYVLITFLGWLVFPIVRIALHGLKDKGYPIAKLCGLLILALPVWLLGSMGVQFNRWTISLVLCGLILVNGWIFLRSKDEILQEIKANAKYYLKIEIITLLFFLFFLVVRLGNPDLWHPYKGGEKPMDFSYFTAILKSSVFPPYDPWFTGGYINYYYYGFVIAGVPVKWLGIIPSVAYNIILPSFFSFSAMGAFSLGWNIVPLISQKYYENIGRKRGVWEKRILLIIKNPYVIGLVSTFLFLIIGNLGTVRMIFQGFQRLASAGVPIETGNLIQKMAWAINGFIQFLAGQRLNYYPGDWYWIPSRTIPGEPITEFPYFTFLYGDPHAHLFALAITLLVLLWTLSVLLAKRNWFKNYTFITNLAVLIFGALAVGSLHATNTWDFPTYLVISSIVLFYSVFSTGEALKGYFEFLPDLLRRFLSCLIIIGTYIGFSFLLYIPFSHSFAQAYNSIDLWNGNHTPINSYLTHWGLYFFIIISWMFWEVRDWMAKTPLKALKKYLPYRNYFIAGIIIVFFGVLWFSLNGIQILWLAVPLIFIGLALLMRPDQSDIKRFVLLLTIIGLSLTVAVEFVVLRGDVGRMNTVFKFYFQAWTLLSISAACYLIWLIRTVINEWSIRWQKIWLTAIAILLLGATSFTVMATLDKVLDRMSHDVPLTLNGMEYMKYSQYQESNTTMDLSQDYRAILWMQQNIKGSPTIVEGNVPEYRWGNRFTIYTGLPGVVGWNWHQRQQRAILPSDWVTQRIDDIQQFYSTEDLSIVKKFLTRYDVKYIVLGQLEKIIYPGPGLNKFNNLNGQQWDQIYQDKDTFIYKVRDNN